jgi:hypothetical protein
MNRNCPKKLRFGTWNVRSLAIPGASDILAQELEKYKMDVVALQETRWPLAGRINARKYFIYYSGSEENRYYGGVGFAVNKKIAESVISFEAKGERMCNIRLRGKFKNISIISFYAPTEEAEDDVKDHFYELLEEQVEKLPSYDIKIILGDANAKVGREDIWKPAIGKESLHQESNDNGTRLTSFALANNLKISSTMFPRKDIHKYTWTSPNGFTRNQIDHVLVDQRHKSSITDVRSVRGAECGTDHSLVLVKVDQKIAIQKRKEERSSADIDFGKLEDKQLNREFELKLENRFQMLQDLQTEENDINSKWNNFKKNIIETAKEICGEKRRVKKKPWFDEECEQKVIERKERKRIWINSDTAENKDRYIESNKETNKILRRKKRMYVNSLIDKAEQERSTNNARDFYRKIRFFKKGFTPNPYGVKDKEGVVLTENQKVLERWREYFYELLNVEVLDTALDGNNEETYCNVQPDVEMPSREEVEAAVKALKNNKAPGKDEISAEVLKKGGDVIIDKLWELVRIIWEKEMMPNDWQEAIVVPIHKKGEKEECGNFRGISLLSIPYKVVSKIVLNRIEKYTSEIILEHQAGFMKGRSTINQIFILKEIISKYWEFNKEFFAIFIDFQKAYDSINREKLWIKMERFGIPKKLVNLARSSITEATCSVRVNGQVSESFRINSGVRQGDGLSPILFNIAIEEALQKITNRNEGIKIGSVINTLAFADDVVIFAEKIDDLSQLTKVFLEEAGKIGLKVNNTKTKYVHFTRNRDNRDQGTLQVNGHYFEKVDSFKYLGVVISEQNTEVTEIQNRLNLANRCFYACNKLMSSKLLSHTTKIRIYKTIISPILLYGAETWKLDKREEKKLIVFENKILRKIFGPVNEGGEWRKRHNRELRDLYREPDVVGEFKCRRIRWAGHVLRRKDDSNLNQVLKKNPEGRRPVGRPRRKWWSQVRADMEKIGATEEDAENRERWRGFVGAAKYLLRYVWPWQ